MAINKEFRVKHGLISEDDVQVNGSVTATSFIGNGSQLTGISSFSGNYNDLTNKPVLFSGSYNDLTNKPTIPSLTGYATEMYVNIQVANLVDSSPETLNTLNELAAALGDDPNFATTVSTQIGLKANTSSLATVATSGSYNDLINKPTIPTVPTTLSSFTNDTNYATLDNVNQGIAGFGSTLATVAFSGSYNDLTNKPSLSTLTSVDTLQFNTSYSGSTAIGQLNWNSSDGTLDVGMQGGVVLQVGQETHYVVRNETGSAIQNGTSVYCGGVTAGSGRMTISKMIGNGSIDPVQYLGLVTHDINNGVNGIVTFFGYVRGLDTRGTSNSALSVGDETWDVGDKLYVHPTVAGKLTKIEPQAPNTKICVAVIINRHQNSGVVFVRPTTNLKLNKLSDVQLTSSANNDVLKYDDATGVWKNAQFSYNDLTNKPTITPTAISDQNNLSTGYFDVPAGTTAERPLTASSGMIRYNTDNGNLEQYTTDGWQAIEPSPSITSVSPTSYNGEAGTVFTISGANYKPGATVQFITVGNTPLNASVTTRVSSSQLTATTPRDILVSEEPLTVRVINPSGLSVQLDAAIDAGTNPSWVTASGSLATVYDSGRSSWTGVSIQAIDLDSGSTISYAITSGALPAGVSFNSSTGAITGTPSSVSSDTTSSFTIRATDNAGNTADRNFSLTVRAPVIETYSTPGTYTWTKPSGLASVQVLAIGGGGGGGGSDGSGLGNGGASGGGAYATVNISSFSSLSVGVGGGGGGGGDSCDSVATENTGGSAGTNGGGRGGNAGGSPCSGGGGGGGGWSGIYSSSTYLVVGGGGGGGGGSNEGPANDQNIFGGGNQPNGNTGTTTGSNGQNYSGDGGGWGGGGGGYYGGVGGGDSTNPNGGGNFTNGTFCSGAITYTGNNVSGGAGNGGGPNLSVGVASTFGYSNNYGGGGNPTSGQWSENGASGILYIKY